MSHGKNLTFLQKHNERIQMKIHAKNNDGKHF